MTQKSWIFVNFRPPGPPEVLKMLLRVPFRKTLQIETASGTHFSGFSWIWAPKLEAKIVPPKNNSSIFCSKMPPKTQFSKFSGFYWIFLQFSPKFPDLSINFATFFYLNSGHNFAHKLLTQAPHLPYEPSESRGRAVAPALPAQ